MTARLIDRKSPPIIVTDMKQRIFPLGIPLLEKSILLQAFCDYFFALLRHNKYKKAKRLAINIVHISLILILFVKKDIDYPFVYQRFH
jgi:hypothetical protein